MPLCDFGVRRSCAESVCDLQAQGGHCFDNGQSGLLQTILRHFNKAGKLAASPGFAPSPPVSETGALLIMQRGNGRPERFCPSDFWV
jgi:hypothetical protein